MIDVLIIGGGPAGVSAALYTARANLKTCIIYKDFGALTKAEKIDNFYGSPGVTGRELITAGLTQAADVGVEVIAGEVVKIEAQYHRNSPLFKVETTDKSYTTRAVLLTTGANRQTPNIPGLSAYEGKGVSHCAVCDAFFYKGKDVAVLGHGQYALSEVMTLLPVVNSVTLLANGSEPEITFPPEVIIRKGKINKVLGEARLTGVDLLSDVNSCNASSSTPSDTSSSNSVDIIEINGLFIAIGTAGATDLARKIGAFVDNNAVITDDNMQTNVPGLWAAGDCTGGMKQIAKAVYDGAKAGTDIVRVLREIPSK